MESHRRGTGERRFERFDPAAVSRARIEAMRNAWGVGGATA